MKPIIIKILLFASLTFIFSTCANQLNPGGGEEDKNSPRVTSVYPENKTLNFSDNKILIEFDEYIDKKSCQDAIQISPFQEVEPELIWRGKELEINFSSNFQSNKTYVLSLSTEMYDLRRNKLDTPLTLTFSTGNLIDTCELYGKIFGDNIAKSVILLYEDKGIDKDITTEKPSYLAFPNKSGEFVFKGLAKQNYKLYAIKDEFKDYLYDFSQDQIGIPSEKYSFNDTISTIIDVNLELIKEDTLKPKLISVKQIDINNLAINFNKQIDSSKLNCSNFELYNSNEKKYYNILGFCKNINELTGFIITTEKMTEDTNYIFSVKNIYDIYKNNVDSSSVPLSISNINDTLPIRFEYSYPAQGSQIDYSAPSVFIRFSESFKNILPIDSVIVLADSLGTRSELKFSFYDSSGINLIPKNQLKMKTPYKLKIRMRGLVDYAGNKSDTIITIDYKTKDQSDFGSLSGTIINYPKADSNIVISLVSLGGKNNLQFKKIMKNEKKYSFDRIEEGQYFIKAFIDKNKDGKYTPGSYFNKTLSEKFLYITDTLKVRGRWPIKDFEIDLKKLSGNN